MQVNSSCPNGSGNYVFFNKRVDLNISQAATQFAFAYTILDIIWEVFQPLADIVVEVMYMHGSILTRHLSYDSRVLSLHKIFALSMYYCISRAASERFLCCGNVYSWIPHVSFLYKIWISSYTIWTVEKTIAVNGFKDESQWGFVQVYALLNMLAISGIFVINLPIVIHLPLISRRKLFSIMILRISRQKLFGMMVFFICPVGLFHPSVLRRSSP
jgi:hypothetical protein